MLNLEVLRNHMARKLGSQPLWLICGLAGSLLFAAFAISLGYEVRQGFVFTMKTAKSLVLWNIGYTWFYITIFWLGRLTSGDEPEHEELPLSGYQRRLHYLVDLGMLPLICALAACVVFAVLLVFTGEPYAHGAHEKSMFWVEGGVLNPWAWRMALVAAVILSGSTLVLAAGLLIDRLCPWKPLAIALLPAVGTLAHFAIRRGEWDFFRFTYRQTSGYSPWLFLAVLAAMLAILVISAWSPRWLRWTAGGMLAAGIGALAVVAMAQQPGSHDPELAGLSRIAGDLRFVTAWYAGHLHPLLNISLLLESFPSSVVIDNPLAGTDQPWRIPLWLGAAVYPLALC
ncbi:MAG TPA: hypothetical protein ENO21_02080, partial [Firmicutes bacterium]|nr:hypothetical protein [Bacillota bacterium]